MALVSTGKDCIFARHCARGFDAGKRNQRSMQRPFKKIRQKMQSSLFCIKCRRTAIPIIIGLLMLI
jgi:hypothetical protein